MEESPAVASPHAHDALLKHALSLTCFEGHKVALKFFSVLSVKNILEKVSKSICTHGLHYLVSYFYWKRTNDSLIYLHFPVRLNQSAFESESPPTRTPCAIWCVEEHFCLLHPHTVTSNSERKRRQSDDTCLRFKFL